MRLPYYYTEVRQSGCSCTSHGGDLPEKLPPVKYTFSSVTTAISAKVGDWLTTSAKSSDPGLGGLARRRSKEAGFVAGIWLAPFSCSARRKFSPTTATGCCARRQARAVWIFIRFEIPDGQVYSLDLTHPAVLAWVSSGVFDAVRAGRVFQDRLFCSPGCDADFGTIHSCLRSKRISRACG